MAKQIKQYGTWPSPITPQQVAAGLRLNDLAWDGDTLIWSERRGKQGVLVAQHGTDAPGDLTGSEMSVSGRVGYGGGEFTAAAGFVYFVGNEGRLYRLPTTGGPPQAITPAFGGCAAPSVSSDGEWVVYVHTYEHQDGLALVDTAGQLWPRKLVSGTDFVIQPVWHPQGAYLAYIAWDHPQMPWDGTRLYLAALAKDHEGVPYIEHSEVIAGDTQTAIFQPEFSPDGRYLAYISDETGFGQLYVYDIEAKTHTRLTDVEAEHGTPAWVQGMRTYGWTDDSRYIYFIRNEKGIKRLWQYHLGRAQAQPVPELDDYTSLEQIAIAPGTDVIALIASAARIPPRIISYVPDRTRYPSQIWVGASPSINVIVEEDAPQSGIRIHQRAIVENLQPEQLTDVRPVEWQGHDGETVYGLYYAPVSDRFEGRGTPPLIVMVHGGPTSQAVAGYGVGVQFFATRGFAVLQVNHRGSTGYGKAYMDRLRGNWGIYDVEDSASGASYLADQGLADRDKFVIMGGSAGGFTVLQSLVSKPGFYRAGVCSYGISNQFMLVQDTHKFEERYSDTLLGPLPDAAAIYRERSPLFHADKIVDALIVFQGEDDPVVPKNQSDTLVAKLRGPHEYHVYPGEGHGFRQPQNIDHYYNSVMKFLTEHVIYG